MKTYIVVTLLSVISAQAIAHQDNPKRTAGGTEMAGHMGNIKDLIRHKVAKLQAKGLDKEAIKAKVAQFLESRGIDPVKAREKVKNVIMGLRETAAQNLPSEKSAEENIAEDINAPLEKSDI